MHLLLTFTAYGAALPGGRGRIDGGVAADTAAPAFAPAPGSGSGLGMPEPRPTAGTAPAKWPAARLGPAEQEVILRELPRIARLRGFTLRSALVDIDHVHVLLTCDADCVLPRLVQLVKGALSRALTVAAGDHPAVTASGRPLPHHKWWARQHALQAVSEGGAMRHLLARLDAHGAAPGCRLTHYDPPMTSETVP